MPRDISRRKLLALGIFGGIGVGGFTIARSQFRNDHGPTTNGRPTGRNESENRSGEATVDQPSVGVERVVRVGESDYEVTFRYANLDDITVSRNRFTEGAVGDEPPQEFAPGQNTFTVLWQPDSADERLVWEVSPRGTEPKRAVTRPHRWIREQWSLTLPDLRAKFEAFDPIALAVRTNGPEITIHLHRNQTSSTFRLRIEGLVSYETNEGWWEVDASLEELIPTLAFVDSKDDDDLYTMTMANSPYDGSQRMSHVLTEGTHWGANTVRFFPGQNPESAELDPDQPDEVYSSVRVYLDQEWSQPVGNTCKIYWAGANLSADGAGNGGRPPTGDDGWSARIYLDGSDDGGSVSIGSYVYHLDQEGQYGDLWEWPDELSIGEWNRIDTYVRLNSVTDGSAARDGLLRTYLNDTLQDERFLRWRTTDALGFDRIGPGSYWGGDEVSPRDNIIYYDDFRFTVSRNSV